MATATDSAPGRKNVYGLSEDMRTFPATEHKSFIKKVINVLINALPEADQVGRTDLDDRLLGLALSKLVTSDKRLTDLWLEDINQRALERRRRAPQGSHHVLDMGRPAFVFNAAHTA